MAANKTRRTSAQKRETEQVDNVYRGFSQKKGGRGKKNTLRHRKGFIVAISIAAFVLVVGIIAGYFLLIAPDDGLIAENVYVAGVNVGGLSKEDAINAVRLAAKNTYTEKAMVVTVEDKHIELSPKLTGANLNVEEAVNAAYEYGRNGSKAQQLKDREKAKKDGYTVNLEFYLNLDSAAIQLALNSLGSNFVGTLQQSSWEVIPEGDGKALVVNVGTTEYALDLDVLYKTVITAYNNNVFEAEGVCKIKKPDAIDLEAIFNEHCKAPVDAILNEKTGKITKEVLGFGFDIEETKALIEKAKDGDTVKVSFTDLKPAVTTETIQNKLYPDVLATYTAVNKESDKNRNTNLLVACKAINGTVLKPGETFSYNKALGPRNAENGYKLGPSYSGNNTVYTYGGGICQVSSALYYCTLIADLEIVERENHGLVQDYVPLGADATVSWDTIDFKFKNNTGKPIRIEASASGGSVTVTLSGTDSKDYKVAVESKIIYKEDYSTTTKTMKENNADGYRNGDVIVRGYTGYKIETYRCKYDKQTDALLSKELEDTSIYRVRDEVVCKIQATSTNTGNTNNGTPGNGGGIGEADSGSSLPDE